jgi:hypothetical protein
VQATEEKLNPIEVSINTWAAPTYKLDYPEDLTEEIYATIKPILEEWSGKPMEAHADHIWPCSCAKRSCGEMWQASFLALPMIPAWMMFR